MRRTAAWSPAPQAEQTGRRSNHALVAQAPSRQRLRGAICAGPLDWVRAVDHDVGTLASGVTFVVSVLAGHPELPVVQCSVCATDQARPVPAFFGGVVMTPLILWLSGRPDGPPKMTLFLPAFWVLVPGAAGLIGVTEAIGVSSVNAGDFSQTALTVASITAGILVGATTWTASSDAASSAKRRFWPFTRDDE